jgi:hypothetical protein
VVGEGWSLVLPPALAGDAAVTFYPAEDVPGGLPAYVEITFASDYPDDQWTSRFAAPRIRIYRYDGFASVDNMLGSAGQAAAEGLLDLLALRPALDALPADEGDLPMLVPGARPAIFARAAYADFLTGTGYRALTYFTQDLLPPDNDNLTYVYQGLSYNSPFFIDAQFPVNVAQLPPDDAYQDVIAGYQSAQTDDDYRRLADQYAAYLDEVTAYFDALAPDAFTPDLSALDALLASLTQTGDTPLDGD